MQRVGVYGGNVELRCQAEAGKAVKQRSQAARARTRPGDAAQPSCRRGEEGRRGWLELREGGLEGHDLAARSRPPDNFATRLTRMEAQCAYQGHG